MPTSLATAGTYLISADNASGTNRFYVSDTGTAYAQGNIYGNQLVINTTAAVDGAACSPTGSLGRDTNGDLYICK
jgi:hypothetical protein